MKLNRLTSVAAGLFLAVAIPGQAMASDVFAGEDVYAEYCASCHGVDGYPLLPDAPDFSMRERLDKSDYELVETIMMGRNLMPAFNGILTQQEILDVLAFLRTF